MKKLFIAFLFIFSVSLYAEDFKGVLGFTWGMSQKQALEIANKKGYSVRANSGNDTEFFYGMHIDFINGETFGGTELDYIFLIFEDHQLWSIDINLKNNFDFETIKKSLMKKYGFEYLYSEYYTSDNYIVNDKINITFLKKTNVIIINNNYLSDLIKKKKENEKIKKTMDDL